MAADKTDPRLDYAESFLTPTRSGIQALVWGMDAAGRAAGIVSVDTSDPALHRRLVAVIEASECVEKPAHDNTDGWKLCAICEVDAILAALREFAR